MNKLLTKIVGVALGATMAVGVGVAAVKASDRGIQRADAASGDLYSFATAGSTSGSSSDGYWTFAAGKNSGTDPVWNSDKGELRIYVNGWLQFTGATNVTLNSAEFTIKSNQGGSGSNKAYPTGWSVDHGTIDSYSGTLTSATVSNINSSSFKITVAGAKGNVGFKSVTMNYTVSGSVTYTVTYDANGATSGAVPVDENSYDNGDKVTVLDNTNNLSKTDYLFAGWNTLANGSGTPYSAGDEFFISSNTTLYAQWEYSIHYTDDTNAKTITWDLSKPEYISASATQMSWDSPRVSMVADKQNAGTATNNYCPPAQQSTRFYAGELVTFAPKSQYKIISIVAEATTENYASALASSTWTNASASSSTTTVTITPVSQTSSVAVTLTGTVGLSELVVHYASAAALSSIAISGTMTKTAYYLGDNWDPAGLIVTATYSDSSTAVVTGAVSWTYNPLKASAISVEDVDITASYTENGVEKTDTINQEVTVTKNDSPTVDTITIDDTDATSGYVETTGIQKNDAVYTSQNAKDGTNLQYRSKNENSGIVSTTSGGLIKSVAIVFKDGNAAQMDIYAKNTAYESPSDLYDASKSGTLVGSISTDGTYTFEEDYKYVGLRSSSGARYIASIAFSWAAIDPDEPSITIDQSSFETEVGLTGTLTATTENAGANAVVWSTSDPSVVSINSSSGAWSASEMGVSTITATLGSTGKKATIVISVCGRVSVSEARDIIDDLEGQDSPYRVIASGYVVSSNGDGTSESPNSIVIADLQDSSKTLQIYFGWRAVSNWSTISVANAKIKAKGTLFLYQETTYEMKDIVEAEILSGVEEYAALFLGMLSTDQGAVCNAQGNTVLSDLVTAWGMLAEEFDELSPTDQATLSGGQASESGNIIARALALYDYIGKKYNTRLQTQTLADYNFMNRASASPSNAINPIAKVNSTVTIIIVTTISLVSVSALGAYFLLRKKKEER